MFNCHDITRDSLMLHGPLAHHGYDWWWHSFTAQDAETGEDKPFFIEFFVCNPALAEDMPVFGQTPENKAAAKQFGLKQEDLSEEEWAVLTKVVEVLSRKGGGKRGKR